MKHEEEQASGTEVVESDSKTTTLLPFPYNQQTFCRYEPIAKEIERANVFVVDSLLRDKGDLSEVAKREWGNTAPRELKRERRIANLAIENIVTNVKRLVRNPTTSVAALSDVSDAVSKSTPDAIIISGTLRDFDYYNPELLESFGHFIRNTSVPVLGIGGGHQLIGLSFGARVITLDRLEQHEQRENRPIEYQYRFIRVTEPGDPIFRGIASAESSIHQDERTSQARIIRVWQNHGLQLDRVPEGFKLLATSYLCRNQMMVKRSKDQLIYTVQFHLEKSFEDWNKSRTRWEHPNESRDGRMLFENFLKQALLWDRLPTRDEPTWTTYELSESTPNRSLPQEAELQSATADQDYVVARIKDTESGQSLNVDTVYTLEVGIHHGYAERLEKAPDSSEPEAPVEFEILVHGDGLRVGPARAQSYVLRKGEDVEFVKFDLTPTTEGQTVVRVEIFFERHWLANIDLQVNIIEATDFILIG